MATILMDLHCFITIIISLFISISYALSQTLLDSCVMDIQFSSSENNSSNCLKGDWDGFFNNTCCRSAFENYLQALGQRANQTGLIYLNATEQMQCLNSMESIDEDVLSCGIDKLTSGVGGCSDYTVSDVSNVLASRLQGLGEDCKLLDIYGGSDQGCNSCLRRWREMAISENNSKEAAICRFTVLVTLTSLRISDQKWMKAVYKCLGEGSLPLEDQGSKARKRHKLSTGLWILIGSLAGVAGGIVVALWILFVKSNQARLPKRRDVSINSLSEESSCHGISIKEVYSATNNLNASNFIGQGIAGKVYKGILSKGQHVAVKHIINDGEMDTFVREVTSLSHVRHPNLVALLGHCEGEDECFLVYELCHNGNLSEWLFGKEKILSWIQRLEIAIDCARGLWFLHTYPGGCIVHRDIKPTNILLCANYQGKLADFGLSKVIGMGRSYVSSEVRGTFGYVDPEYQRNRQVNPSGDVYSFGIVLLQLLSGQRIINLEANRPMPLSKMAKILTRGRKITEFADPKLNGEYSVEAFESVFKLALSCSGIKQQRPSMEQVVVTLEKALDLSTRVDSFPLTPHFSMNMD